MARNRPTENSDGVESIIGVETASLVYGELGHLHGKINPVLESYEENGLEHVESYQTLKSRQAQLRQMRGYLVEKFGEEVR